MKCAPHEAHVWRIELDCATRTVAALSVTLSLEERRRADRFRSIELRERWTVAHAALRFVLARYARCEPSDLVFKLGEHGKPTLTKPVVEIPFNFCHTGNVALVGISGGGRVGIDAETLRPDVEIEELSGQFFAAAEAAEIHALPPDERLAAFFTCWCRKEAFVKALGNGLSMPLNRFQVSVNVGETARVLWADGEDVNKWSLFDISEPGTAAALIIEGPVPVLRRFDFVAPC